MRRAVKKLLFLLGGGVDSDPFNFAIAATERYRIGMYGNSIGAASTSTLQKFEEDVRARWGDAGTRVDVLGGIGGSYTNIYQTGWYRQPYGGPGFVRLRASTAVAATPITRIVFGNQIEYFYSRELDSADHVINVNGVDYTVGAAGAQAYGQKLTITVPLGAYTVTINPPTGAGYAYPERLVARNTAAVGVEVEDYTYGGSALSHAVTLQSPSGSQVAGVAISGDTGINSQFEVPDLDLAVVSFTFNDADINSGGISGWVRGGAFAIALGKLLNGFRARNIPVIYLIEMAGHHIMPNDAGNGDRFAAFNAAKAAILAQAGNGVYVLNWDAANRNDADIPAYAAAYYSATSLNVAAGTYSGDFTIPISAGYRAGDDLVVARTGVPIPYDSTSDKEFLARVRSFPAILQGARTVTVDATPKTLTAVAAAAQPLVETTKIASRLVPVFVDPTAIITANAATQRTNIAAGSTDAFGKYLDVTNFSLGSFTSGLDYWVTVKMAGLPQVRSNSATIRIYLEGLAMPYTDTTNFRTNLAGPSMTAGTDAPYLIAIQVRASAASQVLVFATGRMYDIAVTRSDYPVLLVAP